MGEVDRRLLEEERGIKVMSNYKSPINIISSALRIEIENETLKAIKDVGIDVDKDELIKALKYDRNQYDKGYGDGFYEGYNRSWKWTSVDEAFPEESTFVVVTSKCGERLDRVISYYNSEEKQFVFNLPYLNYYRACVPNVVAWMPLPEPYKEGEQE